MQYTGIFVLGVGDALASIVGKRVGGHRWSGMSGRTVEGSIAFWVSVIGCAWVMRLAGYAEVFSTGRYAAVIAAGGMVEAVSGQNDNLTVPLYVWSMLVAVGM